MMMRQNTCWVFDERERERKKERNREREVRERGNAARLEHLVVVGFFLQREREKERERERENFCAEILFFLSFPVLFIWGFIRP
jgi:hypothetical protein